MRHNLCTASYSSDESAGASYTKALADCAKPLRGIVIKNSASTFGKKVRGSVLRDCIIKLNPDSAAGKGKYFLGVPLLRNKDALLNFWISRNNTAPCGSNVDLLSAAELDMADAGILAECRTGKRNFI